MTTTKTRPYDAAEYLDTEEKQRAFLIAALEESDPDFFAHAVGIVIRARGATHVAREAGISRASIYKSFREGGNPEFGTMMRVLQVLGVMLTAAPAPKAAA
jgi:probable addiction module antidote protein